MYVMRTAGNVLDLFTGRRSVHAESVLAMNPASFLHPPCNTIHIVFHIMYVMRTAGNVLDLFTGRRSVHAESVLAMNPASFLHPPCNTPGCNGL